MNKEKNVTINCKAALSGDIKATDTYTFCVDVPCYPDLAIEILSTHMC